MLTGFEKLCFSFITKNIIMKNQLTLQSLFMPSEDIVARKIEDEMLIIPLASGIGDLEEELYSLNETAQVIWQYLDGKNTLENIVDLLLTRFDTTREALEEDVFGLLQELYNRGIVKLL
ncbi:PqqD family peptide modification chaperone [candidate division KSB1 bacterium]|nr:PqqD family peptide modification chaperone [candidate division KSB1 bacterium]